MMILLVLRLITRRVCLLICLLIIFPGQTALGMAARTALLIGRLIGPGIFNQPFLVLFLK